MMNERNRKGRGPVAALRGWWESVGPKAQAGTLVVLAVLAVLAMVMLNPLHPLVSAPSDGSAGVSSASPTQGDARTDADDGSSDSKASDSRAADDVFDGDAEDIADKVRALLNSPSGGNIDTLGQLLIRHGDQSLGDASDVFAAVGRQEPADTVRPLAEAWYGKAVQAAAGYRRADLRSMLPNTEAAVGRLPSPMPSGCAGMGSAVQAARAAADDTSASYDALTDAQQGLTKAVVSCTSALDADQIGQVFPQDSPSAILPDDGKGE